MSPGQSNVGMRHYPPAYSSLLARLIPPFGQQAYRCPSDTRTDDLKQFGQHWITAEFLEIDPPRRFVWQGHFAAPLLFTVRHSFKFEVLNGRQTRFKQIHENSGLLIPFLALRGIYWVSRQGYLDFDQALKTRCEKQKEKN